jgi:hypothetical protein
VKKRRVAWKCAPHRTAKSDCAATEDSSKQLACDFLLFERLHNNGDNDSVNHRIEIMEVSSQCEEGNERETQQQQTDDRLVLHFFFFFFCFFFCFFLF